MKTFAYTKATSVADAATALAKGNAALLAGGTDLMTVLKSMCTPAVPATLVDIKDIAALAYIKEEGGMLKVGATTTLAAIAKDATVLSKYTALAQAAKAVAAPQIRNMGTIAGNICQQIRCWYYRTDSNLFPCLRKDSKGLCYALSGDARYHSIFGAVGGCIAVNPSDIAPVLVAFGASIVTNKKTWKVADFFAVNGEKNVAIAADEIVTEIQLPTPAAGSKSAFLKFALRKAIDFPIVNCAAVVTQTGGTVSAASVALNAVHNNPKLVNVDSALKGKAIDATSAEAAGTAAVTGAAALPANGQLAIGNKYMIQEAKILVKRAILACK